MPVASLFIASTAGAPMTSCPSARVVAGLGMEGDRYREHTGHWSDPRWPDQELTLIEGETADALGIAAGLLRRNVVTRRERLTEVIGTDVRIGSALLRVVRPCDPCTYLEE